MLKILLRLLFAGALTAAAGYYYQKNVLDVIQGNMDAAEYEYEDYDLDDFEYEREDNHYAYDDFDTDYDY